MDSGLRRNDRIRFFIHFVIQSMARLKKTRKVKPCWSFDGRSMRIFRFEGE